MKKIEREKMNKEDKYSNRMSLPKDGMILAENDDILLRAVSEGQDPRNELYKMYTRFLTKYQPRMFVFENVAGLLTARGGDVTVQETIRKDPML